MEKKINIQICMGSSCFSRGNNKTIEVIKKYFSSETMEISLTLKGSLCCDSCSKGPNIIINETLYSGVTHENIIDILKIYS